MKLMNKILFISLLFGMQSFEISVADVDDAYFQEYKQMHPDISRQEFDFHIEQQLFGRLSLNPDDYKELLKYDEQSLDQKLLLAVTQHDTQEVEKILPEFSRDDLNKQLDSSGITLLFIAVHNGYLDIVQLLVQSGADINAQVIVATNDSGFMLSPETLLSHCMHVPQLYLGIIGSFEEGQIILYYSQRYLKIVKYLIQSGADISVRYNFWNDSTKCYENITFLQLIEKNIKIIKKQQKELGVVDYNDDVTLYKQLDLEHAHGYYDKLRWYAYELVIKYLQQLKKNVIAAKKITINNKKSV